MAAPPQKSIQTNPPELRVLFRIISRRSWDELQSLQAAFPRSRVEHILYGIYTLVIPPGGARKLAR
jgi:hypothetical protein